MVCRGLFLNGLGDIADDRADESEPVAGRIKARESRQMHLADTTNN